MVTATDDLRALIETERDIQFWGETHKITPAFVAAVLGDGKQLLWFEPMNTRPRYYVIRIGSGWLDDADVFVDEHLGDIIEAIADEYGEMEREREVLIDDLMEQGVEPTAENTDLDGNEDRLGWPVLSLDSGYSWGEYEWPKAEQ